MHDEKKTKKQLVKELVQLRQRMARFETAGSTGEEQEKAEYTPVTLVADVKAVLRTEIIEGKQADQAAYEGVGEVRTLPEAKPESAVIEAKHRRFEQIQAIYRLTEAVSRAQAAEEIYEEALDGLQLTTKADRTSILLFDDDHVMRFKAWRGLSDSYRETLDGHSPWSPEEENPDPILLQDIAKEEDSHGLKNLILDEGIRALGFIPLINQGQLMGEFMIYFDAPHEFTAEEVQLTQTIATFVAFALQRQRVQVVLRENEERYRTLYESNPSMYFTVDARGMVLSVNQFGANELGYSVDELLGQSILRVFHKGDRAKVRKQLKVCLEQPDQLHHWELRKVRSDGSVMWVDEFGRCLPGSNGDSEILVVCHDITERKKAQEDVQKNFSLLNAIVEATPDAIFAKDLDGRYTLINAAGAHTFGKSPQEIVGKADSELFARATADKIVEDDRRIIASGDTSTYEETLTTNDDTRTYITTKTVYRDLQGRCMGLLGVARDITERKQMEKSLRESEERYRTLFQHANDAIFVVDLESQRILKTNDRASDLLGYRDDEFTELAIFDLDPPGTREYIESQVRKLFAEGATVFEHDLVRKDRSRVAVEISARVIRYSGKQALLSFVRDITVRKRAEETLRSIVEGTSRVTGAEFFRSLVQHVASALEVRHAFVTECTDSLKTRVRSLAFWSGDKFNENFEYDLEGTPCEEVVSGGKVCFHPEGIQALFPKDTDLVELGAEAYMGIPLNDSSGGTIGHLAVLDNEPMTYKDREASILKIFAARAGAELERTRAEEGLRIKEKQYRDIFESVTDGLFICDPKGQIAEVNQTACKMYGYDYNELIGLQATQLVHPDERCLFEESLQSFKPGQRLHIESVDVRKDGSPFPVEVHAVEMTFKGTAHLLAIVRDISERKRAEELLKLTERRYRELFEYAPTMYVITRDQEAGPVIADCNEKFFSTLGRTREQVLNRPLADFYSPDSHKKLLNGGYEPGLEGEFAPRERQLVTAEGNIVETLLTALPERDVDGAVIGKRIIFLDITERRRAEEALREAHDQLEQRVEARTAELKRTNETLEREIVERKRAEEALRKSEARYHNIFRTTAVSIGEQDLSELKSAIDRLQANGVKDLSKYLDDHPDFLKKAVGMVRVLDVNDATLKIFGAEKKSQLVGELGRVFMPESLVSFKEQLVAIAAGKTYFESETVCQTLQGEPVNLWITMAIPSEPEKFKSVLVSTLDITERKQAEATLRLRSEIAENMAEGVYMIRCSDGIIVYANPTFEQMFGYDAGELVGQHVSIVNAPTDKSPEEKANEIVQSLTETGTWRGEVYNAKKDGSPFWCQTNVSTFDHPGYGQVWISMHMDITERKQAEAALASQEALYRTLIQAIPHVIWLADAEGQVTFLNKAWQEWTGRDIEDSLGSKWAESLHPEDAPGVLAKWERACKSGEPSEGEFRFKTKDGSYKTITSINTPVRDDAGKISNWVGIDIDITERKKAGEALRWSEQRYQLAVDAGKVGVWDWSLATNEIYLDPKLKSMLGYEDHEIKNHMDDWAKHVYSQDLEACMKAAEAHLAGMTPRYEVEHRMVHKDGSLVWFIARATAFRDEKGNPYRMVGTDTDITDLKNAEDALRQSEERFSKAFHASPLAICISHLEDSRYIDVNNRFLDLFGYDREEVIGKSAFDLGIWLQPYDQREMWGQLEAKSSVRDFETQGRTKQGDILEILGSVEMIELNGKACLITMIEDVTERKKAQEAKEKLRQKSIRSAAIVEAQENERRRISRELHDGLGQILTAVRFNFEALEENLGSKTSDQAKIFSDIKHQLNSAVTEGERISYDLMPRILDDFGIVPALQLLCTQISQHGQTKVTFYSHDITKRLRSNVEMGLYRIAQEALNNVVKHAGATEAEVQIVHHPDSVNLVIEDYGKGFSSERMDLAGEDEHGMGLINMRERAEALNGSFTLNSRVGKGTEIIIEIPLEAR